MQRRLVKRSFNFLRNFEIANQSREMFRRLLQQIGQRLYIKVYDTFHAASVCLNSALFCEHVGTLMCRAYKHMITRTRAMRTLNPSQAFSQRCNSTKVCLRSPSRRGKTLLLPSLASCPCRSSSACISRRETSAERAAGASGLQNYSSASTTSRTSSPKPLPSSICFGERK